MLAHGVDKVLIGKLSIDVRDANGKAFDRQTLAALGTANDDWVTYVWTQSDYQEHSPKEKLLYQIWQCNHRRRGLQLVSGPNTSYRCPTEIRTSPRQR
jgi:hypothetical protein